MRLERQQSRALQRLYRLANAEIAEVLRAIPPGDSAAIAEVIVEVVPTIAERYGLAAGSLAADWYERMREQAEAAGDFDPILPEVPARPRWESMAAAFADKQAVEALVTGGVQRAIANMHRETIMGSAVADPQAAGWARFAGGSDGSCDFCLMLISRGATYSEATARFGAHDNCNCGAGPVFKGRKGAQTVRGYVKSARRREGPDGEPSESFKRTQAAAKRWIAENT